MDPFVAEIRMFGGNFAPRGWASCDGQLLPISQNTALFSLLGTTYGGNGTSNFALPNLQGRAPMFWGQGPGLGLHDLGESSGSVAVTLTTSAIPSHSHLQPVHQASANTGTPSGQVTLAQTASAAYGSATSLVAMGDTAGGGQPHENRQPYLAVMFIIAMQGVYPPRT